MAECEFIQGCIFFNDQMANMPSTAEIIKGKYCRDCWPECARYTVVKALGRGAVPKDLFPNQLDRAKKFIKDQQSS